MAAAEHDDIDGGGDRARPLVGIREKNMREERDVRRAGGIKGGTELRAARACKPRDQSFLYPKIL